MKIKNLNKGGLIPKQVSVASKSGDSVAEDSNHPLFSLEYLQDEYIKDEIKGKFFFNLLCRLRDLEKLGWREIMKSHRHGMGAEKIPISQFKPDVRSVPCVTDEVESLLVFRNGNGNLPMACLRSGRVVRVLYVATTYSDLYKH